MTTLKFKCTLLSDVILNQKAATEGPNKTLDFIPGSCFLGIVASKLYARKGECIETMELFHSGKVRFGDAHPSNEEVKVRGLKIPASMFYPKLKKPSEECYIHHAISDDTLGKDKFKKKQLKQCRSGYYIFADKKAKMVDVNTNFAIKSAYDRDKRRSKDENMYGYESLQKGLILYFDVEVEKESLAAEIKDALVGEDKRVGRSRSAQYGLVKIEEDNTFKNVESGEQFGDYVTVYADGRLIFLDDFGLPTFRPRPKDLGLDDEDEIVWEKSQIRTFQYAPWNFTRQCFDADRCGIEKGSVFVVKTSQKMFKSQYVGSYNNEGFGKVIYNPAFLLSQTEYDVDLDCDTEGHVVYKIKDNKKDNKDQDKESDDRLEIDSLNGSNSNLCKYLAGQKQIEMNSREIYKMVNDFVDDPNRGGLFLRQGEKYASQWGKIRSISMQESDYEELKFRLFGKKEEDGHSVVDKMAGYLSHGIALEKWEEKDKVGVVEKFYESIKEKKLSHCASEIIVNLAAEMAKKMRRKEKKNHVTD